MPKIPVVSPVLRTSSLCHGYFSEMVWPEDMEEERRKIWSKILAQAIGPIRAYLKDTSFPQVVAGSLAEQELHILLDKVVSISGGAIRETHATFGFHAAGAAPRELHGQGAWESGCGARATSKREFSH